MTLQWGDDPVPFLRLLDKDDPEMLETLVRAAVNEGVAKAHELVQAKMAELTGGMDIPGLTS